jgi:hypothetical protein
LEPLSFRSGTESLLPNWVCPGDTMHRECNMGSAPQSAVSALQEEDREQARRLEECRKLPERRRDLVAVFYRFGCVVGTPQSEALGQPHGGI